jgi:hypothetical protein
LADAVYPETPQGVLDRFRIDAIHIVDDNSLPLVDTVRVGNATITNPIADFVPNGDDRTVDIQLGFRTSQLNTSRFEDHELAELYNPFYFDGVAYHEMGHARYLIDVYGFDVDHGVDGNEIMITEAGQPIVDTPFMPARPAISCGPLGCERGFQLYDTPIRGLMGRDYGMIDRYSAAALNLIAGQRALAGNFNAPLNLGEFMNDLPAQNRLTVTDTLESPLPFARVSVYQSDPTGKVGGPYFKYYDDEPDLELVADSDGGVLVGRNPFGSDQIMHGLGGSNAVAIVRVEHNGAVGYGFLEAARFNLEYWSGNEDLGEVEFSVVLIEGEATSSEQTKDLPDLVTLIGSFPNPFSRETTIEFELAGSSRVTMLIYDVAGKLRTTLLDDRLLSAGSHRVRWDPPQSASGLYICSLIVDGHETHHTMVRLR